MSGGGNLAGLVDGPARWAAEHPAVLVGDRPVRTWSGLAEAGARRGAGLRERLGVRAGGVAVPISSRLHPREAAALLQASRARVCFADADFGSGDSPVVVIGSPE